LDGWGEGPELAQPANSKATAISAGRTDFIATPVMVTQNV
jgi:hypothetical protein